MRRILSSLLLGLLCSCSFYSFQGGGLPKGIKTAAVSPFENETTDPTLGQEVNLAIREAVQRRLGLRPGSEEQADVIVRGTIRNYDPDQATAFSSGSRTTTGQRDVQVTQRQVMLAVEVEIFNRVTEKAIMRKQTFTVDGEYTPGREAEGRKKALEKLVLRLVEQARSQW